MRSATWSRAALPGGQCPPIPRMGPGLRLLRRAVAAWLRTTGATVNSAPDATEPGFRLAHTLIGLCPAPQELGVLLRRLGEHLLAHQGTTDTTTDFRRTRGHSSNAANHRHQDWTTGLAVTFGLRRLAAAVAPAGTTPPRARSGIPRLASRPCLPAAARCGHRPPLPSHPRAHAPSGRYGQAGEDGCYGGSQRAGPGTGGPVM